MMSLGKNQSSHEQYNYGKNQPHYLLAIELFEVQVKQTPDEIAVVFEE